MLDALTNSPHFYHYLYLAVLALAVFNLSEVLFLLYHKNRREGVERRKEELKRRAATAIITTTSPEEILPRPSDDAEYAAYSEAASSILESFEGEIAARASGLIYRFGIDVHYKNLARSAVWFKRASAIDTLTSFRLKQNREFFLAVFRSETSADVKYRIVRGLSLLVRDLDDLRAVMRLLSSLPYLTAKYTEDVFFNEVTALKLAGREDDFGAFMRAIMDDAAVHPLVKRDCLSACHAAACDRALPIVREYYDHFQREPEVLVACVKSLVRMGDFGVLPRAMRHPDWRVRLTALKYAELSPEDQLPALKDLLKDRNYHIRVNAALALSRSGPAGLAALREGAASGDRFAADAASYALAQAEAGR